MDLFQTARYTQILFISQPALSKALRLLEKEVGASLIEPEGRGLILTSHGRMLLKETAPLLQQWLRIPQLLASGKILEPTKIGSFEVFTTHFLANLTRHVELQAFELHEYGPGSLEQAVASGKIDVGITYAPIPNAQVEFFDVAKIRMGIFGLKKFKTDPWSKLPFVIPIQPLEGTPSKVVGLDGWPEHRYPRHIKYRVHLMESAMELCRLGFAVVYLPEFVAQLHNQKVLPEFRLVSQTSPVSQKYQFQSVFMIKRKNSAQSKLYRQIARSLRILTISGASRSRVP